VKICTLIFLPIVLLLNTHCVHAQFTATSVFASGNASVSGGGFPSDSDSFSTNNFTGTNGVSVSAFSGLLLNSGSSSVSAATTQFGDFTFGGFQIQTSVSAEGFETFSPSAGVQTRIVFQLDTAYDVAYVSNLSVTGPGASVETSFEQLGAGGNTALTSDSLFGDSLFGSDFRDTSFTGRIGAGIYSFGSDGNASSDLFSSGDSFQSITLTPVPEPSALLFLTTTCLATMVRRSRKEMPLGA
jgi:hypothetical protein